MSSSISSRHHRAAMVIALCAGSVVAGTGGTVLAVDLKYEFNTNSGEVKKNEVPVTNFEGVPILVQFPVNGIRTWIIAGDMVVPPLYKIEFTGDSMVRLLVGGNLVATTGTAISASAKEENGGPGGG